MLANVYLFCLAVGVIYSLITTFINGLVSAIDMDFGVDGFAHVDLSLPIRPFTVMIMITVFGGSGLILIQFMWALLTLPIAACMAYIIAKVLYHLVYVNLCKMQTTVKSVNAALGCSATVLETIPHEGTGRISYKVNKNILSGVAKEQNPKGNGLKKGTIVWIVEIKDNIYYVSDCNISEDVIAKVEFKN